MQTLSEERYQELADSYSGICRACGEVRHGDTEPDAEDYPCDGCGANAVWGVEQMLLIGEIEIG